MYSHQESPIVHLLWSGPKAKNIYCSNFFAVLVPFHTTLFALVRTRWNESKYSYVTTSASLVGFTCCPPLQGGLSTEGSQMLFYVWFEFTSWLRGVGQGKGAWDCFLTIWAWDSCAFCQWDQWLLRDWTFILQMTLSWPDVDSLGLLPSALMFCLNLKKVPPPILTIKIPCKNDLRWDLRWLQITTHVIE